MSKYTPEQVERQAGYESRNFGCAATADILRAYAATLRQQAERGDGAVSDEVRSLLAHVYGMGAAHGHHYTVEGGYTAYTHNEWRDAYREVIDEAINEDTDTFAPLLRAPAEHPCCFAEALNVIENWAGHGNHLYGDDVCRFRSLADQIAPAEQGARVPELDKLLREMVDLHDKRQCVLTVHMDRLKDLLAAPSATPEGDGGAK